MSEVAAFNPGPAARFRAAREELNLIGVVAARMAEGETPEEICRKEGWAYSMFAQWVIEDTGRAEMFARASRFWVDALARSTVRRAMNTPVDKVEIAHSKMVIDTQLRVAGKLDRERWGDKVELSGRIDHAHSLIGILSGLGGDAVDAEVVADSGRITGVEVVSEITEI